jgi:nitric oxide reductase NorD protein
LTTNDSTPAGDFGPEMANIEKELERFPSAVTEKYAAAKSELESRLRPQDLLDWANHALAISGKAVRSWEAAAEYLEASPAVQRQLPSGQFIRWAAIGGRLCDDSPSLAVSFFKASPDALTRLRPRYVDDWANLGRALYRGTWKSSNLACHFYEVSPQLLESLTFAEFTRFGESLQVLSRRSYDLADECLVKAARLFPRLGDERDAFITVSHDLAEHSWREVKSLYDAASTSLTALEPVYRSRMLVLARRLISAEQTAIGEFFANACNAVNHVPTEFRQRLLELAEEPMSSSPASVSLLITQAPNILDRLSPSQFEEWHREGMRAIAESPESGPAYYRLESATSRETLDQLSSGVELSRVKDLLRTYCAALSARDIEVNATSHIVDKKIGWVDEQSATTEGTTIYLPPVADRFSHKDENFGWYKVIATHQSCHIEFGSFDFDFDTPSTLFEDLRPNMQPAATKATDVKAVVAELAEAAIPGISGPGTKDEEGGIETAYLTDMGRFFDMFVDRALGLDIFTVVEDTRLDARILHEYKGLAASYLQTQAFSLEERPRIEELPMREAMVEFIVRLSLRQTGTIKVPKAYTEIAQQIRRIVNMLSEIGATVEDSAEAATRIYAMVADVPNNTIPEEEFEDVDLDDDIPEEEEEENTEEILQMFGGEGEAAGEESGEAGETDEQEQMDEESYDSPEDVDYRGEFKPEMAQLLSQISMDGTDFDGEPEPITQEQLEELLKNSTELEQGEMEEGEEGQQQQMDEMLQNLMKEMQQRDPDNQQFGDGPLVHVPEEGGPLEATEPNTFVYPEWDFRANDYKPKWCVVHEKEMAEGEPGFYQETLNEHSALVREIHRQFELVMPEMYRKVKRLEDGEEFDLDAVIESVIDRRTGTTPSDKVFWRRNKVERDVAVAFLLDMSASTAEAIDENKRPTDDWGAPDDPVEYMVWLRSRRAEGLRRSYKRIIDIEKEGIILLTSALEQTGDTYGIYGFSGYGRENVEFYVIKEMQERWGPAIPKRIDRIAPLHATRMGPAIRHVTSKLTQVDAKSRVLFMISDGRPQDRGYSREGVEKEYAVHDTRVAFDEARKEGVTPFCLTVDKNGHDYLKTMMQGMSYEVLSDIAMLPTRLPQLYRELTQA